MRTYPINDIEQMESGETYCYNQKTDDIHVFQFDWFDGGAEAALNYRDGFCADLTREKIEEHIEKRKVFKVVE